MIHATGDIGIQWLTDLYNVKWGHMYSRGVEIECGISSLQG